MLKPAFSDVESLIEASNALNKESLDLQECQMELFGEMRALEEEHKKKLEELNTEYAVRLQKIADALKTISDKQKEILDKRQMLHDSNVLFLTSL